MSLGSTLRELRLEKRLSQKEIAKMLNVSGVAISNYERDARIPSMDTLKKMANIFNVTIDYLVSFAPENGLTENEKRDIGLEVDNVLDGLSNAADINFYGEPLTEEGRQNLKIAIQMAMEMNKVKAKEKFTPKKHKK